MAENIKQAAILEETPWNFRQFLKLRMQFFGCLPTICFAWLLWKSADYKEWWRVACWVWLTLDVTASSELTRQLSRSILDLGLAHDLQATSISSARRVLATLWRIPEVKLPVHSAKSRIKSHGVRIPRGKPDGTTQPNYIKQGGHPSVRTLNVDNSWCGLKSGTDELPHAHI